MSNHSLEHSPRSVESQLWTLVSSYVRDPAAESKVVGLLKRVGGDEVSPVLLFRALCPKIDRRYLSAAIRESLAQALARVDEGSSPLTEGQIQAVVRAALLDPLSDRGLESLARIIQKHSVDRETRIERLSSLMCLAAESARLSDPNIRWNMYFSLCDIGRKYLLHVDQDGPPVTDQEATAIRRVRDRLDRFFACDCVDNAEHSLLFLEYSVQERACRAAHQLMLNPTAFQEIQRDAPTYLGYESALPDLPEVNNTVEGRILVNFSYLGRNAVECCWDLGLRIRSLNAEQFLVAFTVDQHGVGGALDSEQFALLAGALREYYQLEPRQCLWEQRIQRDSGQVEVDLVLDYGALRWNSDTQMYLHCAPRRVCKDPGQSKSPVF